MSTFYLFAGAAVVAVVVMKIRARRAARAEEEALLALARDAENAERAREIIVSCAMNLKNQRAAGCGPWLSALIDGPMYINYDERGGVQVKTSPRPVTPGLALSAVRRTICDLSGGRFDLRALYRAARDLEEMMGEGA